MSNLKATSIVLLSSPKLTLKAAVVPPPEKWNIEQDDPTNVAKYTHINFDLISCLLSPDAHGLLGVSKRVKYDQNGHAVSAYTSMR
mgnify:CR=1 FL=1